MLFTTNTPYQPSHISRKLPSPSFQSPLNPTFRKEGDQDPWNDYVPDELTLLNNENLDPTTNISSSTLSQKTKQSNTIQKLTGKDRFYKPNDDALFNLSDNRIPFEEQPMNIMPSNQESSQQKPLEIDLRKKPITFEKAYKDLAQRLLDHQLNEGSQVSQDQPQQLIDGLLLGPAQIKEIEAHGDQVERGKMMNFAKKLDCQSRKIQQKMNNLQQEVLEHELKECTFAPNINRNQANNGGSNRDFNDFLEGQRNFQQKLEAKKQALKDTQERRVSEEARMRPMINNNSKKLVEMKSPKDSSMIPVYERLYNSRFASQQEIIIEESMGLLPEVPEIVVPEDKGELSFVPTIHARSKQMVRNEPIEDILYKDAQRRQEGYKKKLSKSKEPTSIIQKQMNSNSEKLIIQRFIKEFEGAIVRVLNNPPDNNELNVPLDYLSISEVMKCLGFLSQKEPTDPNALGSIPIERSLLSDLWTILKGEEYGGISKRNLCMFLLSVQGLYWSEGPHTTGSNHKKAESEGQQQHIGAFNDKGEWEVDSEESRWIHKTYDLFYRTRLASENLRKQKTEVEKSRFQPEISETSKVLAEHYRERLLEEFAQIINNQNVPELKIPENGALTHTDLLVLQKKTQVLQHEKKSKEKQIEETKNCSFKPKINSNGRKNAGARHLELYAMGKKKPERNDRDPREIEFEKNCEECTFKPEINIGNKTRMTPSNRSNKDYFTRNVEKTVERLRNARKEREIVKLWTERGIPLKNSQINGGTNSNSKAGGISSSRITRGGEEQEENNGNLEGRRMVEQEDEGEIRESPEKDVGNNGNCDEIENSIENRIPLLYVDVNLGANRTERIVVFEGDESEELAERFVQEHGLDSNMKFKLKDLLDAQIAGVLTRIEEERASLNSDSEFNHQLK